MNLLIQSSLCNKTIEINLFIYQAYNPFKMLNIPNQKVEDKQRQMLGRLSINPLMYLYVPILICTPLYTYYMAVTHNQQKKFPWATVTMTACHYPQDIVFRYTMLIASSIISLTFFVIFRWLENECERVGHRKLNKLYFYFTEFSMICYSITIGTIDQKGIGKLHGPCAVIFFVIWVVVIVRITTFISSVRKWDTSIISHQSQLLKKLLAYYVIAVWIYCIYGLLTTPDDQANQKKSDQFVVIVEWNSVLINLLWVLTFVMEWNFYPKAQTCIQGAIQKDGFIGRDNKHMQFNYPQNMNGIYSQETENYQQAQLINHSKRY